MPECFAVDRNYPVTQGERGEAACVSLPQFSYDVYLPSGYLHDGLPSPVIYTISYNPNGMVETFREACEQAGVIGIGILSASNESNWRDYGGEVYAVMRDVRERLNVDPSAQFVGGMSGGAWGSYEMAKMFQPHVAGVFAMGGWLGRQWAESDRYLPGLLVARSNGDTDRGANSFLVADAMHLGQFDVVLMDWSFPGGHVESPSPVQVEIFQWLLAQRQMPAEGDREAAAALRAGWKQRLYQGQDAAGVISECMDTLITRPRSYFSLAAQDIMDLVLADCDALRRAPPAEAGFGPYAMDYFFAMAWVGLNIGKPDYTWSAQLLGSLVREPGTGRDPATVESDRPPVLPEFDLPLFAGPVPEPLMLQATSSLLAGTYRWSVAGEHLATSYQVAWTPDGPGLYPVTLTLDTRFGPRSLVRHIHVGEGIQVYDASSAPQSGPIRRIALGMPFSLEVHARSGNAGTEGMTIDLLNEPALPFELHSKVAAGERLLLEGSFTEVGTHGFEVKVSDGVQEVTRFYEFQALAVQTAILAGEDGPLRYWAPDRDLEDDAWATAGFANPDGDRWLAGFNGVGYDDEAPYRSLIQTDVRTLTFNRSPSVLLRIPFQVEAPEDVWGLRLRIQYDDGFVAYLNGEPVAVRAAGLGDGTRAYARFPHSDSLAVLYHTLDLTRFHNLLIPGENMLAIRGMNESIDSSDMLFRAVLEADLSVAPAHGAFAEWILATRPPDIASEHLAPDADADGDGASNQDEFYFGGNAWDSSSFPRVLLSRSSAGDGTGWLLDYRRLAGFWAEGMVYRIEAAGSLEGPWRPIDATTLALSEADLLGHQSAVVSVGVAELLTEGDAAFLRVTVAPDG